MACFSRFEQFVILMSPEAMQMRQALPILALLPFFCIILTGFFPVDRLTFLAVAPASNRRSEMPWGRVLTFDDPSQYQAAIRAGDWQVYPTKKGQFRAELTQITLNRLWMQGFYHELPQIKIGAVLPNRKVIGFLTEVRQPAIHHRGEELSPDDVIVNTNVMHIRAEGACRYGGMSLPQDDFDIACQTIVASQFDQPSYKSVVRPKPELMRRLLNLQKSICLIAKTTPELFEFPEVVRAFEQNSIHLMVRCLTEGTISIKSPGSQRQEVIVKRFEDFLEANPNTPLYLTEICAAVGAAERTMRAACEDHLGMGPIRYLALRRMHLVRRALLLADSSTATVTRIATDYGFWELGRFAVAYRALFGEPPSATLKRPPECRVVDLNRPSTLIR
jgi:AraC-like DNA-binding protein